MKLFTYFPLLIRCDQQQSTQNSQLFQQYQYKYDYSPQKSQQNLGTASYDLNSGLNTINMNQIQPFHIQASPYPSIVSEVKSPTANGIQNIDQRVLSSAKDIGSNYYGQSSQQNIQNYNYNSPYQQQKENNRYGQSNQEQNLYNQPTGYGFQSNSPSMQGINTTLNSYQVGIQQQTSQQNSTNIIPSFMNNNMSIGNNSSISQFNQNQYQTNTYLGQQFSGSSQLFQSQNQQDPQQLNMSNLLQKTSIEFTPSISHMNQQFNNVGMKSYHPPLLNQLSETTSYTDSFSNIQQSSQNINQKQSFVNNDSKFAGGIIDNENIQNISNANAIQGEIPQILSSNDNLSAFAFQDNSGKANFNYSNFQDFSNPSQNDTPNNQPPPSNIDININQINNAIENITIQNKQIGETNNKAYFSPMPSISNREEIVTKVTSFTANNTPSKSQHSSITTNAGFNQKSDIKFGGGSQTPQSDMKLKSSLSKAQSPGRNGQSLQNNGNYLGGQIKNFQEINNQEKQTQNQKSNLINSVSQTAINFVGGNVSGSTVDQVQLLPSQKQLVQSIVIQRNRSQSPSNLKLSNNLGQVSPGRNKQLPNTNFSQAIISQSQQFQSNQAAQLLNSVNQSNSNFLKIGQSVNPANMSPDSRAVQSNISNKNINMQGQQIQQNTSKQSTSTLPSNSSNSQQQQGSSQNNYYKVASQIRRNQIKDRRTSMLNSQSTTNTGMLQNKQGSIGRNSQTNINSSINTGVASQQNLQKSLIYSQNYGKAQPQNEQQKKQYIQQQKDSSQQNSKMIRRQNSSGSSESMNQIKNQNKRFTVVDKLNEKYTKKLIIDLYPNDGNPENTNLKKEEGGDVLVDEEDPVKRTNAFVKQGQGNWSNNSNMNMLDILSQQRVLQRSVSSQKRNILQSNNNSGSNKNTNINNPQMNHLQTPQKSALTSSTKRLSFRFNEKPWENTSFNNNSKFNSKYGSFSVMRSNNNIQSNWNLNGSQDLNTSLSSLQNGEVKTISNLLTQNIGSSHNISTQDKSAQKGYQKNKSNNFILAGFNESQDVHSQRNQNVESRLKSKGTNMIDNRQIQKKNITTELLDPNSNANPNNKLKLLNSQNTHLNKPTSQPNSIQKQQQYVYNQQRGSAHIDASNKTKNTLQSGGINKDKKVSSPQPTSLVNSKNSTKSEIKKSQITSGPLSQHNKNRFSEINYSQQESFEKFQDDEYEIQGREEGIDDFEEELQEEDFDNDQEEDEDDLQSQTDGSNSSTSKATFIQNQNFHLSGSSVNEQSIHQINHQARLNSNGEGLRPSTMIPVQVYNFESNLEQFPGLQLNIDELKKERQKLIRKITSTFKVKNKALSTSQEYYKILHVIGKGAFAKVCLAVQILTGKFVAIKLIDKSILRSESAKKRVLQEVQILKKLNNHKHVLKLLEVFESRKLIFIVTEYFRGQDLMKMMKDRNGEPYTENEVRHMLTQILSGLRYVHSNWVLHRDIKLDNLLVDSQLNLKIIDFGISRIIQKDQRMMEQCGTPAFLAPEIIANKGYEGFGSDMWSLGVLIYILLFGKVPFKGNNLVELHKNILNGVLPVDEISESTISFEALSLIQKILKVKVSDRINLEGIINSSWLRGYIIPDGIENKELQQKQQQQDMNPELKDKYSAQQNQQFDEKIIGYIESFGYSREYIHRCLNKSGLSHVNAIYKVIKNSQIQQGNTLYS